MKNQPLVCRVEGDELVIRIGIETLKHATENCPVLYNDETNCEPPYCRVSDVEEMAKDTIREMLREREDGASPLSLLFDECVLAAIEDGSLAFDEDFKPTVYTD